MSSTVTIEVPLVENETVFMLHVVQAARKAYRNHLHKSDSKSDHVNGKESSKITHDADHVTGSFGQPTSVA